MTRTYSGPLDADDNDPLAGFDTARENGGTIGEVYLLQVKTRSSRLDDALFFSARGGSIHDVIAALGSLSYGSDALSEKAGELASALRKENPS